MQGQPPRRHHFVPEFYQRRWAGDDRRVERYELINGSVKRRRVFPSEAGFRVDLYRHPGSMMDEWSAQALEWDVLSKIDDAAAKALDALLSEPNALRDRDVRRSWTIFLRTMLLRTPYQQAGSLAALEIIWRAADEEVERKYAAMRTPGMPETATAYLEALNPNAARESAFRIYAESMGNDRTTHHIMNLPWRIYDCSVADYRLVLSDHPVVLVPLETADGHVAMPLSPTKYLVAATSDRTKAISDAIRPKLAVRIINKLSVQRAQHCVIAEDRSQETFIRKHFAADPIPPFLAPSKLRTV